MHLIFKLEEIKPRHANLCGMKAANLGAIARRSRTSPGFCLTARAYFQAIKEAGIQEKIHSLLENTAGKSLLELEEISGKIQDLINKVDLPKQVEEVLFHEYEELIGDKQNIKVAVRSSATAEDLPTASFAGQLESYLNVENWQEVKKAIIACWASLWTPRGIHYRIQKGLEQKKAGMAVIIQKMVEAQVSGVMFTANPLNNSRGEIYIEAVPGLGDKLVQGEVTGENYLICKENLNILSRGTLGSYPLLTDFSIRQLAHEGRKLEAIFADYQDIEWAFLNEELYILQSRAITTLEEEELVIPSKEEMTPIQNEIFINIQERFPEPMLPLDTIIAKIYYLSLFSAYRELGFSVPLTDWKRVEEGFFPDYFIPPKIKPSWTRIFHLGKMLAGNLIEEWKDNEKAFNRYLSLMEQDMLKDFPMEIILEYLQDGLRDFQRANTFRYLLYIQYGTVYKLLKRLLRFFYGQEGLVIFEDIVVGEPQITMELNRSLEEIARLIKTEVAVHRIVLENPPEKLPKLLAAMPQGKEVLTAFKIFIEKHGHREVSQGLGGIGAATWRDRPEIPWGMIKSFLLLETDGEALPRVRQKQAEKKLSQLTQKGLGKILPLGKIFKVLIEQSRRYTAFREDSHYYLTQVMYAFQTLFLAIGDQLVRRGYLKENKEIMYLTYWEIENLVEDIYSLKQVSRKQIEIKIETRKEQFEERKLKWTLREGEVIKKETKEEVYKGVGASRGIATGVCKVIHHLEDIHLLKPGDILIAKATNPAWTPVFPIVEGVVVEYGSALSHAAIIAREYGIPAIMGVPNITQLVEDGEEIIIDGANGLIRRISSSKI